MSGLLGVPHGVVIPPLVQNEALARTVADQNEQIDRIAYDQINDAARLASERALQAQVDTLEGQVAAYAAAGGAPTSLLHLAGSSVIASIGGDGTKTTVDTVGPHGKVDGDFETISGTVNYNGDTSVIDVISTTRYEFASPVNAATETIGYTSTKRLFLASTASFAVNQYIDVVNNLGDHYRTKVTAVSGSTVTLLAPIPINWSGVNVAGITNPVSWTPLEVAGGSDAMPHGTDVAPTLPRAMRWITGGQYFLEAFRAPGDSDSAAFTKAWLAAPANAVVVIRQDINLATGYTTPTRTTPITMVAQAGTSPVITGASNGTLLNVRANVHFEGIKFSGWDKVVNFNALTAAEMNVKARFIRCSFANLRRGLTWDGTTAGQLKNLVVHGCDFDTLSGQAIYLLGPMDGVTITDNTFDSVTTLCVRIGVKILNPTLAQQNQWKNIIVTDNIARNIIGVAGTDSLEGFQIFGYNGTVSNNQVDGMVGVPATLEMSAFYTAIRCGTITNNSARGLTKGTGNSTVFVFNVKGSSYDVTTDVATNQGYGTTVSDNKAYCAGEGYAFRVQNGDLALHHNYAEDPGSVAFSLSQEVNDHILLDHNMIRGTKRAGVTGFALSSLGSGVRAEYNDIINCETGMMTSPNIGHVGTLVSATATTAVLALGALATDDAYNGIRIFIVSGTGRGQSRIITDYTGATRTVTVQSWTVTPDATSVYQIGASNYVLKGNTIRGSDLYSIRLAQTAPIMGLTVDANIIEDMCPVTGSCYAIYMNPTNDVRDVVIDRNTIRNLAPLNGDCYGIYVNPTGTAIVTNYHACDNIISNLWPGTGNGRPMRFAGNAVAGVTTIQQNDMSNYSFVDAITFSPMPANLRCSNNRGYMTENGGVSGQTPGAVTTVNIPHGLAQTPTVFSVTPNNTQTRNASAFYVTANSTNLTIVYASALTAAVAYSWVWSARWQG